MQPLFMQLELFSNYSILLCNNGASLRVQYLKALQCFSYEMRKNEIGPAIHC
jgi:hypothetical protein